ncbi:MAG: hypothetical protein NT139_00170 [Candidatus Woesearchaeota archaeon]|nr:hypothetical protein [Candidatus Woesearchaeota archaeon]
MLVSQVLIAFDTIRKNPGLNIKELSDKIYDLHGNTNEGRFLIIGDTNNGLLKSRIKELTCISEKKGKYYFNPKAKLYSKDKILNYFVKELLVKHP